jgi:hypothetical protein
MYTDSPEISDAFHIKTDFILFQKERLCFLLEKMIPKSFTKLLFLDSDLVFDNLNWYNDISEKLNNFNIVQPFSKGIWLDITYKHIVKERIPIILFLKFGNINRSGGIGGYHPGFAWAFNRSWYRKVGFFDYGITGSGDTLSVAAWLNVPFAPTYLQQALKPAFDEFNKLPKPKLANIRGTVYHLWHGIRENRKYLERHLILDGVSDVRDIVVLNKDGVFELTDSKINEKLEEYFISRHDDGF